MGNCACGCCLCCPCKCCRQYEIEDYERHGYKLDDAGHLTLAVCDGSTEESAKCLRAQSEKRKAQLAGGKGCRGQCKPQKREIIECTCGAARKWSDHEDPKHILAALMFAAYANELDAMEKLLALTGGNGYEPAIMADDIDAEGRTPLMMAAAGGHVKEVKNGDEDDGRPHGPPVLRIADASGQGVSGPALLPVAYGSENVEAAEMLFERNASDIASGARVRRRIAESEFWEETRLAEEKRKAEEEAAQKRSGKRLWGAARGGLAAAGMISLKGKLKEDVDMVHMTDCKGRTAFIYAAGAGHTRMMEFLMERGADMNAADERGWTGVMYAAERGLVETVAFLIKAGAKLDVEDEQGNSALSVAERVVKNEYMQVKDGETDLDLEDYVGPEMPGEHDPLRTASLAGMRSHAAAPLCRSVRARQEEHAAGEGATQAEERDAARRRVGEAL